MSIEPKSAALFIVDCSSTMASPQPILQVGTTEPEQVTPIDLAKQIVKTKIVQRLIRDLKTTPVGVLTFATRKTKNILFHEEKQREGEAFDKEQSAYRHMYDHLPFTKELEVGLLESIDTIQGDEPEEGEEPYPADALSAFILGMTEMERMEKFNSYTTRELYLITDGESAINWDGWNDAVDHLNQLKIALHVVGFNFKADDPDLVPSSFKPSSTKIANESQWRELIGQVEASSSLTSVSRYLEVLSRPLVADTVSRDMNMTLTLGDIERYPDESIRMHIVVKKAITAGKTKTMKQMSLKSFTRASAGSRGMKRSNEGRHGAGPVASTSKVTLATANGSDPTKRYRLGDIGKTLKRALTDEGLEVPADGDYETHGVSRERRYYYLKTESVDAALELTMSDQGALGKAKEFVYGRGNQPREDMLEDATDAELTDAHTFGGTLVPVSQMAEGKGKLQHLKTGLEIVSFMRQKQIRYDWRLEDVRYIHAQVGLTGSACLFSAFVNAMIENQSAAIVRFVGPGSMSRDTGGIQYPDPQVGIMFPVVRNGLEYCYWCRMPFAEDMRLFYFPSLTEFRNYKGKIIKEHKFIATEEQKRTMDDFVDAMSLQESPGPDGEPRSWFSIQESYSPSIHNINNVLMFRLTKPEGELPPVHPALTKYLDPPSFLLEKTKDVRETLAKTFDTKLIPPKPKRVAKGKRAMLVEDNHEANPDDLFDYDDEDDDKVVEGQDVPMSDVKEPTSSSVPDKLMISRGSEATQVKEENPTQSRKKVKKEEAEDVGKMVVVDDDDDEGPEPDTEPDTEEE